ncbi:MAG TPA: Gmad2 immunoglobulin-like domain-containing protein [Gaiellaceae bacterium]|nr:Gmad2 immunoglobulin-like domain-containing protein [Gaiellaceae bacterium]
MGKRLLTLALLLPALAACGSNGGETAGTTTTAVTTTAPAPPMALTVYRVDNGLLRPEVQHVPRTQAVASASLHALGIDASVTIADGTAKVDLEKPTQDEAAEIVYTLTQFASVERVDVGGRSGLTRDDFASYEPPILVETPASGADVGQTFRVAGRASVFEATLVVQLVRGGKVLQKQTVTASEGAPGRGTFETTLHGSPGEATVQAFSPSAADGSPQHEVDVAVSIRP